MMVIACSTVPESLNCELILEILNADGDTLASQIKKRELICRLYKALWGSVYSVELTNRMCHAKKWIWTLPLHRYQHD